MSELSLSELIADPNYQVLFRLPEKLDEQNVSNGEKLFAAAVIDLETLGFDPNQDKIIEIGLLKFIFSNEYGIIKVVDTYNELNDPDKPIPAEITKITGITDQDVSGKHIDWDKVATLISDCHLIICHNAGFDRNFLELQTPDPIQAMFKKKAFACSVKDVDWSERGYESKKLDYLNWKMGYFYDGHKALTDCWATLNLFLQEKGAFEEIKSNTKKKELLICAINAPFDNKDLLKAKGYRWSDGTKELPKCWWGIVPESALEEEKIFLESEVFNRQGVFEKLPKCAITAFNRYSLRTCP